MASTVTHSPLHSAEHEQFYLASRTLTWWMVGLTFAASWFGASSTLVTLDALVVRGLNGLWDIVIPSLISCGVIALFLARRVALWCRHHGALSMAEAVGQAYGPQARWGVAVIIVLATVTMLAAQLVAAGQAAYGLWQWPVWATTMGFALVILAYSLAGGYKAVVVTDMGQLGLIVAALALPILWLLFSGSPAPLTEGMSENITGVASGFSSAWGTPVQWGTALTFVLGWMVAPEMWQRMQSLSPEQDARKAALWGVAILVMLFALVGTLAWLTAGMGFGISGTGLKGDMPPVGVVWAVWVDWVHNPVAQGVMVLGLLCAIASTMDSCLNVGSMVLACDVWRGFSRSHSLVTSRIAMMVMVLIATWIALTQRNMLHVLWLSADFYASVIALPVVVLLWYAPRLPPTIVAQAGSRAMAAGAVVTLLLRGVDVFHLHDHWAFLGWQGIAWPWSTLWAVGASALVFGVSCLTAGKAE